MKVIKEPEKNWTRQFTCRNCSAILEVDQDDINHIHHSGDFREPTFDEFFVHCSICREKKSFPEKDLPPLVKINAKKKSSFR